MNRLQTSLILTAVVAILTAPRAATAGAIAISSSTSVTSQARIGDDSATPVIDSDSDSQGTTLSTLASSAVAVATVDPTTVSSTNSSTLGFLSADAGTAVFNTEWEALNVSSEGAGVEGFLEASYTFQAVGTGLILQVGYGIEGAGSSTFGLTNYSFSLTSSSTSESFTIDNNIGNTPSVSGMRTYSLIDGETYTLTFDGSPNVSGGIDGLMAKGVATFDFNISVVPEPSSLALAGLGMLGLAAYGLRSRRAA